MLRCCWKTKCHTRPSQYHTCDTLKVTLHHLNRRHSSYDNAYKEQTDIFLKNLYLKLLLISHSVVSDSLRPHESQHAGPACPSPTPGVYSNSCLLSWWCHPSISPSVTPFLPSIFPSIRVFSNESTLCMRWPKLRHSNTLLELGYFSGWYLETLGKVILCTTMAYNTLPLVKTGWERKKKNERKSLGPQPSF